MERMVESDPSGGKSNASIVSRSEKQENGFVSFFLELLFGQSDSQRQQLKHAYRHIKKAGHHYFAFRSRKVLPDAARLLYSVYGTIDPLREFFLTHCDLAHYEQRILTTCLTEAQQDMIDSMSEKAIKNELEQADFKSVMSHENEIFARLKASLSADQKQQIDSLYNSLAVLKYFCTIDYYTILKQFAPSLRENSFEHQVQWVPVPAKQVADQIVDFVAATQGLLGIHNLKQLFTFLSEVPGFPESFIIQKFQQMLHQLLTLETKGVLVCMAQLAKYDSTLQIAPITSHKEIVQPYIDGIYVKMKTFVETTYNERRKEQLSELVSQVFPDQKFSSMNEYNEENSQKFASIGVGSFKMIEPTMYLKTFFDTILERDVHPFVEMLGIRGRGNNTVISDLSVIYHDLNDDNRALLAIDHWLDPKFPTGYKIKQLVDTLHSESNSNIKLINEINMLNSEATRIVRSAMESLVLLHEKLYALLADRRKPVHELIENWEEIDRFLKNGSDFHMNRICSEIKHFCKLLKAYEF